MSSRRAALGLAVSHRIAYPLVPHKVTHCCYAVSVLKGHYAEQRKLFCNKGKRSTKDVIIFFNSKLKNVFYIKYILLFCLSFDNSPLSHVVDVTRRARHVRSNMLPRLLLGFALIQWRYKGKVTTRSQPQSLRKQQKLSGDRAYLQNFSSFMV